MNWDDLRFVLALADTGSSVGAAEALGVDHTTVGRRIAAAERALGLRLFTRSRSGMRLTQEGQRVLDALRGVRAAVSEVERAARAQHDDLSGPIRLTSPETLGTHYLAGRLVSFQQAHPQVTVELSPSGAVVDLARGEAEIAVRTFRTDDDALVVRKVAEVAYGFYGAVDYLRAARSLDPADHPLLSTPPADREIEERWLEKVAPRARRVFVSPVSAALREAARSGLGVAILPCYLGDADAGLRRLPVPGAPSESLWLTVHRDLRRTPRIRALADHLVAVMAEDADVFRGVRAA